MSDEQKPIETEESNSTAYSDDFDVESALAAVSSINEIAASAEEEPEADTADPVEESVDEIDLDSSPEAQETSDPTQELVSDADASISDVAEASFAPADDPTPVDADYIERPLEEANREMMPHPASSQLYRGQLASIVPAFLLMALGVLLTVQFTATDLGLTSTLLVPVVIMGFGLALLVRWLSSSRWERGSFLVGSTILLSGMLALYLVQPDSPALAQAWPLLMVPLGAAFVLTSIVASAFDGRSVLIGLLLLIAGGSGFAILSGIVPAEIIAVGANLWPFAVALLALIMLAAVIRSRA